MSPACQELIFIVARQTSAGRQNYSKYKDLFEVIDCQRLTKSAIKEIADTDEAKFAQTLESYGFFSLKI